MIAISFACGHRIQADDFDHPPVCPACGERRVQHVVTDRAPRFRGSALGPCATFDPTGSAVVVNVAPAGSLALKEDQHG